MWDTNMCTACARLLVRACFVCSPQLYVLLYRGGGVHVIVASVWGLCAWKGGGGGKCVLNSPDKWLCWGIVRLMEGKWGHGTPRSPSVNNASIMRRCGYTLVAPVLFLKPWPVRDRVRGSAYAQRDQSPNAHRGLLSRHVTYRVATRNRFVPTVCNNGSTEYCQNRALAPLRFTSHSDNLRAPANMYCVFARIFWPLLTWKVPFS